jgi:hypothetical protein
MHARTRAGTTRGKENKEKEAAADKEKEAAAAKKSKTPGSAKAAKGKKADKEEAKPAEPKEEEMKDVQPDADVEVKQEDGKARKAAQDVKSYKEATLFRTSKKDYVEVAEDVKCESEAEALEQTVGKAPGIRRKCVAPGGHASFALGLFVCKLQQQADRAAQGLAAGASQVCVFAVQIPDAHALHAPHAHTQAG